MLHTTLQGSGVRGKGERGREGGGGKVRREEGGKEGEGSKGRREGGKYECVVPRILWRKILGGRRKEGENGK